MAFSSVGHSAAKSLRMHRPPGVRPIFFDAVSSAPLTSFGEVCIEAANLHRRCKRSRADRLHERSMFIFLHQRYAPICVRIHGSCIISVSGMVGTAKVRSIVAIFGASFRFHRPRSKTNRIARVTRTMKLDVRPNSCFGRSLAIQHECRQTS